MQYIEFIDALPVGKWLRGGQGMPIEALRYRSSGKSALFGICKFLIFCLGAVHGGNGVKLRPMRRLVAVLSLALGAIGAHATISYQVEVIPKSAAILVTMDIPNPGKGVEVEIPKWAPGSYRYANYSSNIASVSAMADGKKVPVTSNGDGNWKVTTENVDSVRVTYAVKAAVNQDVFHYTGPSTYMYVVGRMLEPCTLKLSLPSGWKAACGLPETSPLHFKAPGYDVLADNPVTLGNFVSDSYTSNGAKITIAYRGPVELVNRAKVVKLCKMVSDAEAKFWGGLPYDKYVWHFQVIPGTSGGGGLEHLTSTEIGLAAGLSYRTVSVLSHEYFHAWNVKRIRSFVLGPFDYLTLPKTGALWWLEGVTDYYADVLIYRGGYSTDEQYLDSIAGNVTSVRRNPNRFKISPYDSSFRVNEAAGGRGNSQGLDISYYDTGWLVGLCLDAELRDRTNGQKSLDTICHDLWEMCKDDQPGFREDEIRKLLVKEGGEAMGPIYDKWVMQPGELPVEAQIAKLGLKLVQADEAYPDVKAMMGPGRGGDITVRRADADSQFKSGDVVMQVGSVKLGNLRLDEVLDAYDKAQKALLAGPVKVTVKRGDQTVTMMVKATKATRKVTKVVEDPKASSRAKMLRKGWMYRY